MTEKVNGRRIIAMSRSGRRPGASTTRAALLESARKHFAATGYDSTSLRTIASDAGVDPAVVMHFFGTKEALFREAVGWPFDPAPIAEQITTPDSIANSGGLGVGMGRLFLNTWEDPAMRESLLALLRSAMTQPASATLLREFLDQQVFGRVGSLVSGPQAELRVNLASAQMVGLAILRYILEIEPLASASTEELLNLLQPTLRNYLDPDMATDGERKGASTN